MYRRNCRRSSGPLLSTLSWNHHLLFILFFCCFRQIQLSFQRCNTTKFMLPCATLLLARSLFTPGYVPACYKHYSSFEAWPNEAIFSTVYRLETLEDSIITIPACFLWVVSSPRHNAVPFGVLSFLPFLFTEPSGKTNKTLDWSKEESVSSRQTIERERSLFTASQYDGF